jgi:hypothetical protein
MKYQCGVGSLFLGLCLFLGGASSSFAPPDLTVDTRLLRTSSSVEWQYFRGNDCNYVEGCLKTPGWRKLLKVDVGIANVGNRDLVIGNPKRHPDLFVWSRCHQHYHMKTMVSYRLLTLNFTPTTAARKQAFCLRDNYPYTSMAGESHGYDCNVQGITAGWEDVYDKSLDCQYVDVTGVPVGTYYLEVEVNPLHLFGEQRVGNNKVYARVTIPRVSR